ncbi:unnamed protein product, partial [Didymodactylos carnosus]
DDYSTIEHQIEITNITKDGCEKGHRDQFDFLMMLGAGSFGKVFLVRKNLGPDQGSLYAMNVLKKATFQTEGKVYLVLDFLRGGDLFTRLFKEVMFTERDVQFYLAELAMALDHLHGLGIIYRDLKPENFMIFFSSILLESEGHIALTDFGLSKESIHFEDTKSQYLSPEAQSLLRSLFKRNSVNRHGAGVDGFESIKKHPFFESTDWFDLFEKRIEPPFIPPIHSDFAHHFDKELQVKHPKLKKSLYLEHFHQKCRIYPTNWSRTICHICHRCIHRLTNAEYAVKIISDCSTNDPTDEIQILLNYTNLSNIIRIRDILFSPPKVYIVTDLMCGGELVDKIFQEKSLSEKESARIMFIIVKTVETSHHNSIVHRDLQSRNIMYTDQSGLPKTLKIVDFGFAKQLHAENGLLTTPCFTKKFVAPEVLQRKKYDESCDIWSLGILLYTMLSGTTPFAFDRNDTPDLILHRITNAKLTFKGPNWNKVSPNAKALVSSMLDIDPRKRPTARDILNHSWLSNLDRLRDQKLTIQDCNLVQHNLEVTFHAINTSPNKSVTLRPIDGSGLFKRMTQQAEKVK